MAQINVRLVKARAFDLASKASKDIVKFLGILWIRESPPHGKAMFRPRQALLFPKQISQLFLRKAFHSSKGIGYLKHAAFDCVSIRARTETQSYQQNLICGNDGDGKRSLDGCPRPIQV